MSPTTDQLRVELDDLPDGYVDPVAELWRGMSASAADELTRVRYENKRLRWELAKRGWAESGEEVAA